MCDHWLSIGKVSDEAVVTSKGKDLAEWSVKSCVLVDL